MKELQRIQQELKAPKNQRNTFGKYNYRSCEDILEAVKPLLKDCTLTLSDEMVQIGERYYIKATVTLEGKEKEIQEATAYAREALSQKGMGDAQITGSASSYARKYALNGLFLIDDNKDDDTRDNTKPKATAKPKESNYEELRNKAGLEIGQKQPLCPTCDTKMLPTKKQDGTATIWFCPEYKTCGSPPINVERVDMAGNLVADKGEVKPENLPF